MQLKLCYAVYSQEERAAPLCIWLGQCVVGQNAGKLQHVPSPDSLHKDPQVLIAFCPRFSVAPIVRSGEADPDVAKFLNRSVNCLRPNVRTWFLYCAVYKMFQHFQIKRLLVHCGQIRSKERRQRGKNLQETRMTTFYTTLFFWEHFYCK